MVGRKYLVLFLMQLMLMHSQCVALTSGLSQTRCEAIDSKTCKDMGYTHTTQKEQADAEIMLVTYFPLIEYKCSEDFQFFVCAVHLPLCDAKWSIGPVGPCRSLCERVRKKCLPIMSKLSHKWPAILNCSKFIDESEQKEKNGQQSKLCLNGPILANSDSNPMAAKPNSSLIAAAGHVPSDCSHLRNSKLYVFINHTGRCELSCSAHNLFSEDDKRLAEMWMTTLAALCCLSSVATLLTFLIDRQRFRYPTRPVIIMSLCYFCYSVSYFVRLVAGREGTACYTDPLTGKQLLTSRGLDNTNCAIVFLLQYFFSIAASAWFAILVLTWLLQTAWKWSPEAVAKRSCYFHVPAWATAIGLTVCVLISRRVEADELLGMCGVGQQNQQTLLTFVIIPNAVFLVVEVVCLVAGAVAMWRVRQHVRHVGQKTKKFDILMAKIGLFSFLYMLPTSYVWAMRVYEYRRRDLWLMANSPYKPSLSLLLIREFGSLAIGLTTVLWIWSCKTVDSWRSCLFGRRLPGNKEAAAYPSASHVRMQPVPSPSNKTHTDVSSKYCDIKMQSL